MSELLPQTATEYLTLAPNTQTSIDVFSDSVIESVQAGEVNPLTVLIQLRAMAKASERILKEIHDNIMTEAGKYPGTEFEFAGNKITKAEHGTRYDFTGCKDTEWELYDAQRLSVANSLKERETFLKALKTPIEVLDRHTGELVTLQPPTKKSTSGLNVSIR